jgi:hypothetical protein
VIGWMDQAEDDLKHIKNEKEDQFRRRGMG